MKIQIYVLSILALFFVNSVCMAKAAVLTTAAAQPAVGDLVFCSITNISSGTIVVGIEMIDDAGTVVHSTVGIFMPPNIGAGLSEQPSEVHTYFCRFTGAKSAKARASMNFYSATTSATYLSMPAF